MSWLLNPHGDPPIGPPASSPGAQNGAAETAPLTDEDKLPKVPDPSNANRMVSTKKANRPFLAYALFHPTVCTRLTEYEDTRSIGTNARRSTNLGNNV